MSAPYVDLPFAGDPYDLIAPLERLFGSLLCYRLSAPAGRRLLFASLEDAWRVAADGIVRDGERFEGGPAALLDTLHRQARAAPAGWTGCDLAFAFSYDLTWSLRQEQGVPGGPGPAASRADALLGFAAPVRRAVVYDETTGSLRCRPADRAAIIAACAALPAPTAPQPGTRPLTTVLKGIDPERYRRQVEQVRDHLYRGDVYQVVVSVPVRVRPHTSVHRYIAEVAARYADAEYSYYFALDGVRVFGNCSLPHLTGAGARVATRVFAGTQPAARDEHDLRERGAVLREDPKYYAEHVMLVDLERNDLGSFCRPETVRVDRLCEPLVVGPTTYLATDVSAEHDPAQSFGAVLTGNFPRGVVVGAPKIRAQEVLARVEEEPRSFFAGAVGGYDATTDTLRSNTIVTCAEQCGDELVLRCGGGVVAESVVEQELSELELKLRHLR